MSFKPGDRIRGKGRPEIEGTVRYVEDDMIFIALDNFVEAVDSDGKRVFVNEGLISIEYAKEIFEITEKSDWADIWDEN